MPKPEARGVPVTVTVGPVTVELRTGEPTLLDYLGQFYPIRRGPTRSPAWSVDASRGSTAGMDTNLWGVGYRALRV